MMYSLQVSQNTHPSHFTILESNLLRQANPLLVLRELRAHYSKKSLALFRVCDPTSEGNFKPRLTFIGVEPEEVLQISGNPFSVLEKKMQELKIPAVANLPFFQGGALGYLSYDSIRYLEPSLPQFRPLYDAEIAFYRYFILFDHVENRVTLLNARSFYSRTGELSETDLHAELRELEQVASKALAVKETPLKKTQASHSRRRYFSSRDFGSFFDRL
jgi:anthranilate/para-aminobenzoate synthase component I